jgi:hypothetical protein
MHEASKKSIYFAAHPSAAYLAELELYSSQASGASVGLILRGDLAVLQAPIFDILSFERSN